MKTSVEDAVSALSARYARIVDRRDFGALHEVMSADARIAVYVADPAVSGPIHEMKGIGDITQAFELLRRYDGTFHFVGQVLLLEQTGREARAETYCVASHFHTRGDARLAYVMYIRYQDRCVETDAGWRIAERLLLVDRVEGEDVA